MVRVMDPFTPQPPVAWSRACEPAEGRRRLARLALPPPTYGRWRPKAATARRALAHLSPGPTDARLGAFTPRSGSLGKTAQRGGMSH